MRTRILLAVVLVVISAGAATAANDRESIGALFGGAARNKPLSSAEARAKDAEATRIRRVKELAEYNARPAEWRRVNGVDARVPWFHHTNHSWFMVEGKVVQVMDGGLLVDGAWLQGERIGRGVFIIKHVTGRVVDGSRVSTMAADVGITSYTTVLGATKTVRVFDRGLDSVPPPPTAAELAAAEAARERRATAAADAERAAAAEKIRVAAAILKSHQVRASEGSEESRKWLLEHREKAP